MQKFFKIVDPPSIPTDVPLETHLRRLRELIDEADRKLTAIEILDGHRLEDISIPATTDTAIPHKLGRKIKGYIVTNASTGANIRRTTVTGEDTSKQFTLYASIAVVVDIWVF